MLPCPRGGHMTSRFGTQVAMLCARRLSVTATSKPDPRDQGAPHFQAEPHGLDHAGRGNHVPEEPARIVGVGLHEWHLGGERGVAEIKVDVCVTGTWVCS